jgi:hypothetical protein
LHFPIVFYVCVVQALICDLLHHVPGEPLSFEHKAASDGSTKKHEVLLDENDPVWRLLRNMDFVDVIETMAKLQTEAKAREDSRKIGDDGDVEEMRRLMQVIASDEKGLDTKVILHGRIKRAIEARFEKRHLHEIISTEMELVTGVDSEGNKPTAASLEESITTLLTQLTEKKDSLRVRIREGSVKDTDAEKLKPLKRAM